MAKTNQVKNIYKTKDEMETAVSKIGDLQRQKAKLEADFGERISALKKELSELVNPLDEEIQTLSEGVKFFMDRNRETYIPEEKKSISLPVGDVGYRKKTASVVVPRKSKNTPDVIEQILEINSMLQWHDGVIARYGRIFLRMKLELDKDMILSNPQLAFEKTGLKVDEGGERFFIKPADMDMVEV